MNDNLNTSNLRLRKIADGEDLVLYNLYLDQKRIGEALTKEEIIDLLTTQDIESLPDLSNGALVDWPWPDAYGFNSET